MSSPEICHVGGKGLLLPLGGDGEQEWPMGLRTVLYITGLIWCFLGVAIIADIFMGAIETITSKKKLTWDRQARRYRTTQVWNDTVANLTLMALGSSAPEILLSVIELVGGEFYSGELGPSTIVGSAAFNLLGIMAVCIMAIPDGEVRCVKDTSVFAVTATFSIFAYIWLIIILQINTENVVDPWEGIITFLFFGVLVIAAFAADKGMFSTKAMRKSVKHGHVIAAEMSKEELAELMMQVRHDSPKDLSDEKILEIIEKTTNQHRSRAAYRVGATRAITGGRRLSIVNQGGDSVVKAENTGDDKPAALSQEAVVEFAEGKYAVLESAGKVYLHLRRFGDVDRPVRVRYKTRDGTARAGSDYEAKEGEVVFESGDVKKEVCIKIIDDAAYEDDEMFYVDLIDAHYRTGGMAIVGKLATADITIIDDDEPGILLFENEVEHLNEGAEDRTASIQVLRRNGSTGRVTCSYHTENDTAIDPHDFVATSGELVFEEGQSSANIEITIKAKGRYEAKELFRVFLEKPTGGAKIDETTDGGKETNICTCYIEAENKEAVDKMAKLLQCNWDKARIGSGNWMGQFQSALYCNGSAEDAEDASTFDKVLHWVSLPWKFIFAMVPPTDFAGGWACFIVALIFIGGVTAIIGDLANLVGCTLGIPAAVTAITFVALGTSLPDTFASKAAAVQDAHADASIGNVTGSNSVNVFLGLGLPWAMGAIYWSEAGATSEWKSKINPAIVDMYPQGGFVVEAGSLGYSVTVFTICAVACLGILIARRKLFGGELGGPKVPKMISSGLCAFLWLLYVAIASVKFVEEANQKK